MFFLKHDSHHEPDVSLRVLYYIANAVFFFYITDKRGNRRGLNTEQNSAKIDASDSRALPLSARGVDWPIRNSRKIRRLWQTWRTRAASVPYVASQREPQMISIPLGGPSMILSILVVTRSSVRREGQVSASETHKFQRIAANFAASTRSGGSERIIRSSRQRISVDTRWSRSSTPINAPKRSLNSTLPTRVRQVHEASTSRDETRPETMATRSNPARRGAAAQSLDRKYRIVCRSRPSADTTGRSTVAGCGPDARRRESHVACEWLTTRAAERSRSATRSRGRRPNEWPAGRPLASRSRGAPGRPASENSLGEFVYIPCSTKKTSLSRLFYRVRVVANNR